MAMKKLLVVAFICLAYYWQTQIKQGPIYENDKSLLGKTVIITGGNTGIGKCTAIEIAIRSARLIIASRNVAKSEAAKEEIIKLTGNNDVKVMKLDLEDFDSVRAFAREIIATEENVDFLVNNAGALYLQGFTKEEYGRIFTINHLGHFLLTNLLLEKMKQQSAKRQVRIINLSSAAYKFGKLDWDNLHYDPVGCIEHFSAYADSKLANIYFTSELHKHLKSYDITTYAVHPGNIYSELSNNIEKSMLASLLLAIAGLFKRETYYGAQTIMYTMLDDDVVKYSGKYFNDCAMERLWSHATNETVGEELWDRSFKMVGLV